MRDYSSVPPSENTQVLRETTSELGSKTEERDVLTYLVVVGPYHVITGVISQRAGQAFARVVVEVAERLVNQYARFKIVDYR